MTAFLPQYLIFFFEFNDVIFHELDSGFQVLTLDGHPGCRLHNIRNPRSSSLVAGPCRKNGPKVLNHGTKVLLQGLARQESVRLSRTSREI